MSLMDRVFGLLSWLFGRSAKKPATEPENLGIKKDTGTLKIHKLVAGPYAASDDPDWDEDDGDFYWIEAMVEYDGYYESMTISHDDFDKIYDIVKHLSGPTVEPYIIERQT